MSQPERDAVTPPAPSRWPGTEPLNDGPRPAPAAAEPAPAAATAEPAPAAGPSGAGGLKAVLLRRDLRIGLAVGVSLLILIGVLARCFQDRKAAGSRGAQTQSDRKIDPKRRAPVSLVIHPHPSGQGAAGSNTDEAKHKQATMRDKLARRADAPPPPWEPTAAEQAKADALPQAEGIDLSNRPPRPRTAEPEPWADPPTLALQPPPPPAPASSQVDLAPQTEPGPETSDIEKLFPQTPAPTPTAAPTPPEAPAPQPTPDADEPSAAAKPPERDTPRANPSAGTPPAETPTTSETPTTPGGSNPPSPPPSAPPQAQSNGSRNEPTRSELSAMDVGPPGTPEPRGTLAEPVSGDRTAASSANPPAPAPPAAAATDNPSSPAPAPDPPAPPAAAPSPPAPAAPINPPPAPGAQSDLPRSATPSGAADGPAADGEWVRIPNAGKAALLRNDDQLDSTSSGASAPSGPSSRSAPSLAEDVIEPVRHVVQHGENFWTIARRYYGSGRYYKALWAANRTQVDAPEKLVVGMTIRVPPLEALDRALVVAPPRTSAPPFRPRAAGEIPLMLPVRSPITERADVDEDDAEARPPKPHYPTYRVKPRDTLRSIARDTLGNPRRASEILEMNRDTIDDPHRLTVGQVLVLPEDARLGRRTR
jgi:nucleoid-associated protein YgaU